MPGSSWQFYKLNINKTKIYPKWYGYLYDGSVLGRIYLFNVTDRTMGGQVNGGPLQLTLGFGADYTPNFVSLMLSSAVPAPPATFGYQANYVDIQFGDDLAQNYVVTIRRSHPLSKDIILFACDGKMFALSPIGVPFESTEVDVRPITGTGPLGCR